MQDKPTPDRTVQFESADAGMNAAIAEARRTLPSFFAALSKQGWRRTGFCLKVRFESGGENEHIWLADIDASKTPMLGTVGNEPYLRGFAFMQRVAFEIGNVTDWMYVDRGYLVGGYTTRLIRSRLSPAERAGMDAQLPFKIRDGG
jgi:uncharacterized protein YegJ (DUF2314 family)